jgi:hypothetical protein
MTFSKRKLAAWSQLHTGEPIVQKPKKAARRTANTSPTEFEEQCRFVTWLKDHKILFFAIPNGARRTLYEQITNKALGLIAGAPDIMICERPYAQDYPEIAALRGLFIEMKRTQGAVVTEVQENMHKALRERGYAVFVAYGEEDAILITKTYLGIANDHTTIAEHHPYKPE